MLLQKWFPLCNLRARDPHQLLLNTSHFLPLSLEKLLSYAGARLLIQLPRKSEILAPNFLRVDALRCFEIGSRAKKTVHTYIPLPCAMYLCCNIYVPTYLSFDSLHNEAKSCLKLYFNKNAYDFTRYFSTFNLQHIKKIKKTCEIRDMVFLDHFKIGLNPLWCALGENKVCFKRFSTKKSTHSCLFRLVTGWFML